jgi:hypothetical protein
MKIRVSAEIWFFEAIEFLDVIVDVWLIVVSTVVSFKVNMSKVVVSACISCNEEKAMTKNSIIIEEKIFIILFDKSRYN